MVNSRLIPKWTKISLASPNVVFAGVIPKKHEVSQYTGSCKNFLMISAACPCSSVTGGGGLGVCADWTVDVDRTVGGMDVGDGSCVSVPIGVKVPPLEAQPESIAQTTKRKWIK